MRISDWSSDVCSSDLHGTEFVVADDHAGLRAAIREVLTGAAYQRCYVHFLRNALDHLPRKADDDCLQELRWLYDRRNLAEARADLAQWLARWSAKYPRLTDWAEETIEETFSFYRSEEHTSELQSLMRNSYAVFCLKKKKKNTKNNERNTGANKYDKEDEKSKNEE